MNFPEIVDIALPAEGVFPLNLVVVSIRKTYPMQGLQDHARPLGIWADDVLLHHIIVVDAGVDVHNTSEVLFHLCANTDPQRDSESFAGSCRCPDHATSEIAVGSKLGIDATKKLPGEGFRRPWPRSFAWIRRWRIDFGLWESFDAGRPVMNTSSKLFRAALVWATATTALLHGVGATRTSQPRGRSGFGNASGDNCQIPAGGRIVFAKGLHGTITLAEGGNRIDKDLTLRGPGAGLLTVKGMEFRASS